MARCLWQGVVVVITLFTLLNSSYAKPATDPPWPANFSEVLDPRPYPEYGGINFTCTKYPGAYRFDLANSPRCGTPLSKDYYGFGVRLGFYTTWAGSWIANNLVPREIPGAIDANSIFLFALEVSILKGTFYDDTFMKVDAVIMLLIGVGTTVGTLSLWGYRTSLYRRDGRNALRYFGGFGTHSRLLLCFIVNLYWLWFWYNPARRGLGVSNCDPRCQAAWIFGRPVTSPIRWLLFTFGAIYQVYWGIMLSVSVIALYARLRKLRYVSRQGPLTKSSKLTYKTGLSYKQLKIAHKLFASLTVLWLAFIITLVETTLHNNNAPGTFRGSIDTTSPSQLIPLLIGATNLIRICYFAYETYRYPAKVTNLPGSCNTEPNINPSRSEREVLDEKQATEADKDGFVNQHSNNKQLITRVEDGVFTTEAGTNSGTDTNSEMATLHSRRAVPQTKKPKKRDRWTRFLRLFSPGYTYTQADRQAEIDEFNDESRFLDVPWWKRVLVTWLPWLGLISGFMVEQPLEEFLAEQSNTKTSTDKDSQYSVDDHVCDHGVENPQSYGYSTKSVNGKLQNHPDEQSSGRPGQ